MFCNIRSVHGARPPVTRMSRIIARVYTLDIARSKWETSYLLSHLFCLVSPGVGVDCWLSLTRLPYSSVS